MAGPSLEVQGDIQADRHPLLMEPPKGNTIGCEHAIDMPRLSVASSSGSHGEPQPQNVEPNVEVPSSSTQVPVSQPPPSSTIASSRSGNFMRRSGDSYNRRHRSPLNSGLWISIELVVTLCQIVASIVVLSLSTHENPQAPLFAWILGYAAGCVATLPLLYWRYLHRNNHGSEQETMNAHQNNSQHNPPSESRYISISIPPGQEEEEEGRMMRARRWGSATLNARLDVLVDHYKMALDCLFAIWFVVGNVWIFGGHSSAAEAPNLYRLCIVFLTFSCIGYAMPFILCATICCCLPCIISILGFREELRQTRGASAESINALPTYKFKLKRSESREDGEVNSESATEGGVLAPGTDKERIISEEDALCCICLAQYGDNEELRELPCSHYFHVACVDKWLKINASCPLCKAELGESASRTHSNRRSNERMIEVANRGDVF